MPSSEILGFIDTARIDRLLAPWVPHAEERAFVVRCLLGEGPAHHRGANYVLLSLLSLLLEGEGGAPDPGIAADPGETLPVPLRLPPHLAELSDDRDFPLHMPIAPIERLAPRGSQQFDAMIDCLTDGPPQHALANAAMVCVISVLLARRRAAGPAAAAEDKA